jgi:hypothetical protein
MADNMKTKLVKESLSKGWNARYVGSDIEIGTLRPNEAESIKSELEKMGYTVRYNYIQGVYFQSILIKDIKKYSSDYNIIIKWLEKYLNTMIDIN